MRPSIRVEAEGEEVGEQEKRKKLFCSLQMLRFHPEIRSKMGSLSKCGLRGSGTDKQNCDVERDRVTDCLIGDKFRTSDHVMFWDMKRSTRGSEEQILSDVTLPAENDVVVVVLNAVVVWKQGKTFLCQFPISLPLIRPLVTV